MGELFSDDEVDGPLGVLVVLLQAASARSATAVSPKLTLRFMVGLLKNLTGMAAVKFRDESVTKVFPDVRDWALTAHLLGVPIESGVAHLRPASRCCAILRARPQEAQRAGHMDEVRAPC